MGGVKLVNWGRVNGGRGSKRERGGGVVNWWGVVNWGLNWGRGVVVVNWGVGR